MRFLIVAASVLACAAAAPSGALLAAPYAGYGGVALGHAAHAVHGVHAAPVAVAHAAPLHVAAPTISPGDIQGAAIDAHVDASDHVRASADAAREYHDQAAELQGRAINAAEDHSWQAVDAVKTREAQLDGAAAGAAPIIAKQLAGHVAPVAAYAAPGYAHGPLAYAGAPAYAAAAYGAASKTVVSQSLSQSHPASLVHAAPAAYGAYAAPAAYGVHAAPAAYGVHAAPAYAAYAGHGLAHGW